MADATGEISGTIAAILGAKQFGFIAVPARAYVLQGGKEVKLSADLFFHHTAVKDDCGFSALQPGMVVRFMVIESPRGLKAVGVERVR